MFDTPLYEGCEALMNIGNGHFLYVIVIKEDVWPEVQIWGWSLLNRVDKLYAPIGWLHSYHNLN